MQIDELLEKYRVREVYLLLPGGNKGDGLIYMGGITLLKKHAVLFREIHYPQQARGKTLLVLGSGGFCLPYHRMPEKIIFYMSEFEEIIILPSSFDLSYVEVKSFIKNLPEKVTVFCREKYSYAQVLSSIADENNLFLDHDLALSFNYDAWKRPGNGRLDAFRLDEESIYPGRIPKNNHDVSRNKEGKWEPFQEQKWEELLHDISIYEQIHTDRAHVSIAGAMLGKQTFVYANNYHKLKGIYEYSLSNLPNVKWAG
jgi:exopolysaccharide biosynthesis predicted pyruvyltransferase EpsI